ncbi:MAG: ABC transporter ATP-binding protein [Bacillota bacterium]
MLLKIENLQKNYGSIHAVDGISFEVKKGEVFGLLGPNGAGKSTTISMISTLLPPSGGVVLYEGKNIFQEPKAIQQKLGVVPQDIALYPTLSGYENLAFWGNMYGLKGSELKKRIDEVAEIIGLNGRMKDRVDKYSGGMKRRINIGAALLHKPDLLIMDEPTVGIDPQSRNHILDTVLELNRQGMTIIYTSHYMEEVEYLCNRICIMDQGKIIASGSKDELVEMIQGKTQIGLYLESVDQKTLDSLQDMDGIESVQRMDDHIVVQSENADMILADIIARVTASGSHLTSVDVKKPNLESVFLHLTGKALRD